MPKFSALTIESQTALKNRIGDDLDLEQDLDAPFADGERAITYAVTIRDEKLVQDLCRHDISLNFFQEGGHSGVVILAIKAGLADIVEILLNAYTCKYGEIPDYLLERVADSLDTPNITSPWRFFNELTNSQVNYTKTRLLVENAARYYPPKPTHPPESGEAAFKDLKETSQTLLDKWSRGMTASKLIKANSINTPLEVEVSFIGRPIVAQYAITYAVILGDEGLVEDLCANGVNLTVRDRENLGKTPLELAEEYGNPNIHQIITSHTSRAPTHV
jgi:ankyrin repeat protein